MKYLSKYSLFFLLLANMTSENIALAPMSQVLFYGVLCISLILLFRYGLMPSGSTAKAPELCVLIFVYLFAQLVLQNDLLTLPNILYTITKIVIFSIMIICIGGNFDFYLKKVPTIFSYVILVLIALGWVYNTDTVRYGNLTFGFVNRNVACTIATFGFAGFLFLREKLRLIDFIFLTFLFITILYGGSRNALVMSLLIILIRYGVSFKLVAAGIVLAVAVLYIFPAYGIEMTALDRLLGTIDGSVAVDREVVRKIAWRMIEERPWTGWGYSYSILPSLIAETGVNLNGHNGYLVMIENLGWPCGIVALSCIIFGSLRRLPLYLKHNRYYNFHLSIIISTLFAANQEAYLIGVNQFTTNIFFLSFTVLGIALYKQKYKQ